MTKFEEWFSRTLWHIEHEDCARSAWEAGRNAGIEECIETMNEALAGEINAGTVARLEELREPT